MASSAATFAFWELAGVHWFQILGRSSHIMKHKTLQHLRTEHSADASAVFDLGVSLRKPSDHS